MSELRSLAARMGEQVSRLIDGLGPDQRRQLLLDFKDETERTNWHYTPRRRQGLPLRDMDRLQQQDVVKLLQLALSPSGLNTVQVIMAMEWILDVKEDFARRDFRRDATYYFISVFGTPHDREPWGWRFEGHHVSLHFTVSKGLIVSPFPLFLGSNPRECELAGGVSLRPLLRFEDSARELLHSLSEEQQKVALLTPHTPYDIILANKSSVVFNEPPLFDIASWMKDTGATSADLDALRIQERPAGIPAGDLNSAQRDDLRKLVRLYLESLPDALAEAEESRLQLDGERPINFAWAGGQSLGDACYYRVQAPDFLIEFDNYQNEANHIHSVWRDPANDFGRGALAAHYRNHAH